MGYFLNDLGNLKFDDDIDFYFFVINGQFREPLFKVIEENFANIARDIGGHAVISIGLKPKSFSDQVGRKYLGPDFNAYFPLLPALLVTDAHPEKLTEDSLRLLVPLAHVEDRFGGWPQFFTLLGELARGENTKFIAAFKKKEDAFDAIKNTFIVEPGLFGVKINVNDFLEKRRERAKRAKTPHAYD